jgi:predicted AlkP superfamily phosphohydrolase/phosphomutase
LNLKGRQPNGCVGPADARALLDELKEGLTAIPHPETGEPLVEHVYERHELYDGPHAAFAPDLTVVLTDWKYRTIGLHDFTTNRLISPAFGPTGDHLLDGILIASGPAFRAGAEPKHAMLLDVAPTVLHLLGVPVPDDMDGRVLTELLEPAATVSASLPRLEPVLAAAPAGVTSADPGVFAYTDDENAEIQQRLADLGYL